MTVNDLPRRPCVFLDRDGVLNEEVYYPHTQEWEGLKPEDLTLCPGVMPSLKRLLSADFALILVSNQGAYAKGKVDLETLIAVHDVFEEQLRQEKIGFLEFCYSYSHPYGSRPGFSGASLERKPGIYFLVTAAARHHLDLSQSWMVGDRDTDIICGKDAGVRTVLIANPHAGEKAGYSTPNFQAQGISQAVDIILGASCEDT